MNTPYGRTRVHDQLLVAVLSCAAAMAAGIAIAAQTPTTAQSRGAEPFTRAEFNQWLDEISNWGRWGADDERGTLNLITDEKRRAATQLVEDGVSVSLARDLNTVQDAVNANPFEHTLAVSRFSEHEVAGDRYSIQYHGFAHSHLDGLPHFAHDGKNV